MNRLPLAVLVAVVALSAAAAPCRFDGCKRYAAAGSKYCQTHVLDAKKTAREVAMEVVAGLKDNVRQAAVVRAGKNFRETPEEHARFARPIDGLFGRRLGELLEGTEPIVFTPKASFRDFEGYTLATDGSGRRVATISAYRDFDGSDAKAARAEFEAVRALLAAKYGRMPFKLPSGGNRETLVLDFGGEDGTVRQLLQLTRKSDGERHRLILSVSTVQAAGKVLVKQRARDLQAL